MHEFPTVDEVRQLPSLADHVIPSNWEDENGHVNIQYYLTLYEIGGWPLVERIGMDSAYFSERRLGFFDLEHHIRYRSELHVGERVTIHGRFLARNKKRIHGMLFIVNDDRDVLACTLEFLSTAANLTSRRSHDFPPEVASGLDAVVAADNQISWPAPVCGAISI